VPNPAIAAEQFIGSMENAPDAMPPEVLHNLSLIKVPLHSPPWNVSTDRHHQCGVCIFGSDDEFGS